MILNPGKGWRRLAERILIKSFSGLKNVQTSAAKTLLSPIS